MQTGFDITKIIRKSLIKVRNYHKKSKMLPGRKGDFFACS